jgi:hypothetical protein
VMAVSTLSAPLTRSSLVKGDHSTSSRLLPRNTSCIFSPIRRGTDRSSELGNGCARDGMA